MVDNERGDPWEWGLQNKTGEGSREMVEKEDELAEANQQELQQGVDGLETVFVKLKNMTTKSSEIKAR